MTLSRTRPFPSHTWPQGIDAGPPQVCETCEAEWEEGYESPPPWKCQRSPLERDSGPKPISDRRDEKRAARGVRGPLCDHVRGSRCAVEGCYGRSDPAHVETVNSGRGDFKRVDGRWVGRVAPLCREHHRQYDGTIGGGSGIRFERDVGLSVADAAMVVGMIWMRKNDVDPTDERHPYEQMEGGSG